MLSGKPLPGRERHALDLEDEALRMINLAAEETNVAGAGEGRYPG
jgi:hypothetical protein